jgi:CheY-like chemotaxis protein
MAALTGLRVLVVEDEGMVAAMIEDMLQDLGCIVAASVGQLEKAREIAAAADIDLALLDVNLRNELVFPVAEILAGRRIPFVFSTGYGASGLPAEFRNHTVLTKPFSQLQLQQAMAKLPVTSTGARDGTSQG